MDINKYIKRMENAKKNWDTECSHIDADDILCEMLEDLGYGEIVEMYREIDKWYA